MRNPIWEGLSDGVYNRLCECHNEKRDIPTLVKSVYTYNHKYDRRYKVEDAMVFVLDHLDSNSQPFSTDLTTDEYYGIIKEVTDAVSNKN